MLGKQVCAACAVTDASAVLSSVLKIANQAGIDKPAKECPVCHRLTLVSNLKRTSGKPVCASCFDVLEQGRKEFLPTLAEIEAM